MPRLPRVMLFALLPLATVGAQSWDDLRFEPVQPDLFSAPGGQPNAWADVDGDGDLDLFVGFRQDLPNRLYRNDNGAFVEVGAPLGVADLTDTRAAAWGDFDGDGDVDLFVGFTRKSAQPARLYRNDGPGRPFTEVAAAMGLVSMGETRQPAFVDVDNDGDLDLFVAMRDAPNQLFRNDGGRFVEVGAALGLADPRRSVGAVWFDADADGDLDVFIANQNGDLNGLFRNDGARFVDVGREWGVDAAGRASTSGSNGPSVADVDNDGDLDLFVASYGPNYFYRNDGPGRFTEMAAAIGLGGGALATPSRWGDVDNDGRIDVYVSSYVDTPLNERDFLFRNIGGRFVDATPDVFRQRGATHGIQWVDFDQDGDLDFSLANNNPEGTHSLYRNMLPAERARQSVQVRVLDGGGRSKPGAEVRAFVPAARTVVGMGIVDSGGGYASQGVTPVHIGLGHHQAVDIEVTTPGPRGRVVTRMRVDVGASTAGSPVTVRVATPQR